MVFGTNWAALVPLVPLPAAGKMDPSIFQLLEGISGPRLGRSVGAKTASKRYRDVTNTPSTLILVSAAFLETHSDHTKHYRNLITPMPTLLPTASVIPPQ